MLRRAGTVLASRLERLLTAGGLFLVALVALSVVADMVCSSQALAAFVGEPSVGFR